MQAQDATTVYLLKLWQWAEENRKSLIAGAAIAAIIVFFFWFSSVQREQKQIAAGEAFTQTIISAAGQSADSYFKIAADHSGTVAAQRALLQGAAVLFEQGNFAEAQTQFQNFLDSNPGSEFKAQAALGVASCLDAQGKNDLAAAVYQRVINTASDVPTINAAKFAAARIDEADGKYNDALIYYEDIAHSDANSLLGSEAIQHLMALRNRIPTGAPAASPAATPSFQLNH